MANRIIAIGDVHGCSQALKAVLAAIAPQPDDLLITLGDYIDRGPDSRGVIEQLIEVSQRCRLVPLLGNHEIMLLQCMATPYELRFWLECGGNQTLFSYGGTFDEIPEDHLAFIHGCRRYYETDEHIFLHANYVADMPLDEQPDYALFWEHVNHTIPPPHQSGKIAVVGHTPQTTGEILDLGHLICIDTHCFGRGWLTALNVETGETWQANKFGELRRPRAFPSAGP
jgi:serine/threonine protein phosphatase 1